MTNAIFTGLMLGGMYALIAMGLTLQYGVARIMNLSYGEFLVAAAFASFWLFSGWAVNPLLGLAIVVPCGFGVSILLYRVLLTPLVRRARTRDALEVDSILATFGMMFIVQGIMLAMFGGAYFSYSFLAIPVSVFGEILALNRLIAFGLAVVVGLALYLALTRTRLRYCDTRGCGRSDGRATGGDRRHQDLGICVRARRRAGGGGRRSHQHVPDVQRIIGRDVHHEGA